MNTCVWEGWTDRWHASEHLQAGGEVWRKAQVRAIWCLLFSRGSSPFGLTFQRWSIIYIGTYHNQLVILYMITLKTLSAKHIILCDILDTRLNRKIPTPWSFSPQVVWTLFRSVQVSGRTATTWAQKFWGGQPRPSWETRNGDIQSKYCQNQLITLYIFTQKTLSAKQIVLCNISDARLNQKIPTPWPISPQGVWTLFSSVQVPQGEQLQLSTEALRKSSSPVLRDMERAGKDWSRKCGEERKMNVAQIWKMLKRDGERSDE